MPLPFGKNQIDKLGKRLAAADAPADDDLVMLEELIVCHAAAVSSVRNRLGEFETSGFLDASITGRAKTTQTIIEKIRRNKTRLSSMEDLAGVRLVADMNLGQQDKFVEILGDMFTIGTEVPKVIDRRVDPRAGVLGTGPSTWLLRSMQ